jgi:hypothetical protein
MSLVTSLDKQLNLVLGSVLLSETMVNKSAEEEPAFLFFKTHFGDLRNLMKRTLNVIKETQKPSVPKPSPE